MRSRLLARARFLRRDALALFYALRDPAAPWQAKLVAVLAVLYAFSPIDLIPDVIPFVGLLDDLVIVPLGLALAFRLLPETVLANARIRAAARAASVKKAALVLLAAAVVLMLVLIACAWWQWRA
ncbi:MAG: DUF1232 domain-containing protein [Proteobacteria bacterium]|nr:DUF1232 domain-containing protein [Pseudomonadota bacterium]